MDIVVEAAGVRIAEPEVLTSFSVVSAMPIADVDAALRADGIGHVADEHAWISADLLQERAAALVASLEWPAQYRRMVDYAISKGWWDAERSLIRAHIRSV